MKKDSVLVVGAGSSGLTTAVELARHGIIADVIEKRDSPSGLSRAVGLLPAAMKVFNRTAVGKAVSDEAIAIQSARVHRDNRLLAQLALTGAMNSDERLFGLPQDRTEYHLRQTFIAQGGAIDFAHEFLGLIQDDSGIDVRIGHADQVITKRYDFVVGADGIRSSVRHTIGVQFKGYELDEQWSIADVDFVNWVAPESFSIYLKSGGDVVIVVPLEQQRYRVVSSTVDALKSLPVDLVPDTIRREAKFKISIRQAAQYVVNRVALVGDAAHAHSPVGGRGMNLGIVDAACLAQCIAQNILHSYHDRRFPEGQRIIKFTEQGRSLITSTNFFMRGIVRVLVPIIGKSKVLQNMIARRFVSL